jgi:23S rRNA (pseudouridine1915-N3)-methyltransferase
VKVHLCVVGRLRAGPERSLVDDYLTRFDRAGRSLGLTLGDVTEVEDRKSGSIAAEAALLRRAVPKGATLWVLDERGVQMTSPDFAARVAGVRDAGRGDLAICIGGAEGLDPDLRSGAALAISFGRLVWPHMLARVMLAEQLYRAASILSGSPYHRA